MSGTVVLGIESSCDETAVALYRGNPDGSGELIAHAVHSQVEVHARHGGVVPELASRDHLRKCLPLLELCLDQSGMGLEQVGLVAYTAGPGLIGALLVGSQFARALAFSLSIPHMAIHHMEGHLLAPLMEEKAPEFPFVALLVSGGHTLLVQVAKLGDYRILGDTLDDAVGEAFDKTAKLLGLPYPGGPQLAALATGGRAGRFDFPRPMVNRPGLDFSFSGLKTHVLQVYRRQAAQARDLEQLKADVALAFEESVVDTLIVKCERALAQSRYRRLVVSGGVSANRKLRERMRQKAALAGFSVHFPSLALSTDNGAMIAFTGWLRHHHGCPGKDVEAQARWSLEDVNG